MVNLMQTQVIDPIESVNHVLSQTWDTLCEAYDIQAPQPEWNELFRNTDLEDPTQSAEVLLTNMLLEVVESVSRFSPWYRMPARSFGLASLRDQVAGVNRWVLTADARQRWDITLQMLQEVVARTQAMLKAILYVEGLMDTYQLDDPPLIIHCRCDPPHAIHIKSSARCQTELICEDCRQPYR